MKNPFVLTPLNPGAAFCDRQEELAKYARYTHDGQKIVLYSPRRYGKTSLMNKLQQKLESRGAVCPYADFSTVTSARDVAHVLMESFIAALHRKESLLEKGKRFLKSFASFRPAIRITENGYEVAVSPDTGPDEATLLRGTMEEIASFTERYEFEFCFVLDEFQQITRLGTSVNVEAILRSKIQFMQSSFFFVGSRRSILLAMFSDHKRPFYKMALTEELKPLPIDDVVEYLNAEFSKAGKAIKNKTAHALARTARGHAYYVQFLAQQCFYLADATVEEEQLNMAVEQVLARQDPDFAAIIESPDFPIAQLRLLKAVAARPTAELASSNYLAFANLASSTAAMAKQKLREKDLIEKDHDGVYRIVDPFLEMWLKKKSPLR